MPLDGIDYSNIEERKMKEAEKRMLKRIPGRSIEMFIKQGGQPAGEDRGKMIVIVEDTAYEADYIMGKDGWNRTSKVRKVGAQLWGSS